MTQFTDVEPTINRQPNFRRDFIEQINIYIQSSIFLDGPLPYQVLSYLWIVHYFFDRFETSLMVVIILKKAEIQKNVIMFLERKNKVKTHDVFI